MEKVRRISRMDSRFRVDSRFRGNDKDEGMDSRFRGNPGFTIRMKNDWEEIMRMKQLERSIHYA